MGDAQSEHRGMRSPNPAAFGRTILVGRVSACGNGLCARDRRGEACSLMRRPPPPPWPRIAVRASRSRLRNWSLNGFRSRYSVPNCSCSAAHEIRLPPGEHATGDGQAKQMSNASAECESCASAAGQGDGGFGDRGEEPGQLYRGRPQARLVAAVVYPRLNCRNGFASSVTAKSRSCPAMLRVSTRPAVGCRLPRRSSAPASAGSPCPAVQAQLGQGTRSRCRPHRRCGCYPDCLGGEWDQGEARPECRKGIGWGRTPPVEHAARLYL